jgi:tRNA threonylcarbamoyladenosine dehydratase
MTQDISWLSRTKLLVGEAALLKLTRSHVMVVGLGGVGSYAAEFIARSGVATNHGVSKALIMEERLKAINPELELTVITEFINPEMVFQQFTEKPDYIIDAIDSITPKLTFLRMAYENKWPIVSSMGAGAKLDPTQLKVVDIAKTWNCPFAQQVRKMLKKYNIRKGIKVVFSPEPPIKESLMLTDGKNYKKSAYGTISYLPAVFGAVAASVVIRDLMKTK